MKVGFDMSRYHVGAIIVFLIFFLGACTDTKQANANREIEGDEYVLGTFVSIKIFDHGSEELLTKCFDRLHEIEQLMSTSIETSEVSRINASSEPVAVSEEVMYVIRTAIEYGDISSGKFDISLGPVVSLWNIGSKDATVPDRTSLDKALSYVDYRNIRVVDDHKVQTDDGMLIDLGGIAKGYAADEVEKIMKDYGVLSAIINLGGNIKVVGEKAESLPFKVGIQGPEEMRNSYLGVVEARDKTVVTSGDYERYFIEDGIKYHHIFDSVTGYPHDTNVASVTVVADSSIEADAMSTILYLMEIQDGIAMVESMDNIDCIYVTKDYEIYISSGLKQPVFKISDDAYKLMTLN